jgi:hypothetical protein
MTGTWASSSMDYGLPRADEVCSFEMDENPVPTKTNPLGVKGAGEAGNVGALAAIMNAVVDALSPLGVTHIDMPATPERVWGAIRSAETLRGLSSRSVAPSPFLGPARARWHWKKPNGRAATDPVSIATAASFARRAARGGS